MIDPTETWEHLGHQVRSEDIAFAQQALAEAEATPQCSQGGIKP